MPRSDFWPFDRKRVEEVDANGGPSVLQKQLGDMEGEVKEIQMELAAIRKDRLDLYNRKHFVSYESASEDRLKDTTSCNDPIEPDDQCNKYSEVAKLREELVRAKNVADEEKFQRVKYEGKLKDLEMKLNNICCTGLRATEVKEVKKYSDGDVAAMKSEIREMKEEMEEMKLTNTEKTEQLQDYRVKYLQAQQHAEELKQQLDVIEHDNKQVSDQIQIEIHRMKMQFQEKLHELAPLPDLLKGAQMQLHEARQVQKIAEDSAQQLNSELIKVKEKLVIAMNNFNQEKADKNKAKEENKMLTNSVDEKQKEIDDLYLIMDDYKCNVLRLQEKLSQQEIRFKEKSSECSDVLKSLEELRTESHRSINRCKERTDSMRRHLQTQISELERQLIQSRAQCKACQKERDEIRQRMQMQISNIQENLELVEIRLRALQSQVASLKSSYAIILNDEEDVELNKITT